MNPKFAIGLTIISLVLLLVNFPLLVEFWIVVIGKAIPSAFTLGLSTVLLYKAFRYPRGTLFTLVGLLQLVGITWIAILAFKAKLFWLLFVIAIATIIISPKSAKATWKFFDVDRYYKN